VNLARDMDSDSTTVCDNNSTEIRDNKICREVCEETLAATWASNIEIEDALHFLLITWRCAAR
jgi:hypothetical protein